MPTTPSFVKKVAYEGFVSFRSEEIMGDSAGKPVGWRFPRSWGILRTIILVEYFPLVTMPEMLMGPKTWRKRPDLLRTKPWGFYLRRKRVVSWLVLAVLVSLDFYFLEGFPYFVFPVRLCSCVWLCSCPNTEVRENGAKPGKGTRLKCASQRASAGHVHLDAKMNQKILRRVVRRWSSVSGVVHSGRYRYWNGCLEYLSSDESSHSYSSEVHVGQEESSSESHHPWR